MEKRKVELWFLGKLVTVEAQWSPTEYVDGYLYQQGYWEVTDLIDPETQMDVWLDRQVSSGLSETEAEQLSDADYEWLSKCPEHWSEDAPLYNAVQQAFTDQVQSLEIINLPIYMWHETSKLAELL
jgi:hypothetical protein